MLLNETPVQRVQGICCGLWMDPDSISGHDVLDIGRRWRDSARFEFLSQSSDWSRTFSQGGVFSLGVCDMVNGKEKGVETKDKIWAWTGRRRYK